MGHHFLVDLKCTAAFPGVAGLLVIHCSGASYCWYTLSCNFVAGLGNAALLSAVHNLKKKTTP